MENVGLAVEPLPIGLDPMELVVDPMELVEVLNLSIEEVTFSTPTGRPKPVPKLYPVVDGRVARYPISCGKRGSVLGTLISPGPGPRETPTRGVRRVRSNGVLQRAVTQNSVANGCIFPCAFVRPKVGHGPSTSL